MKNNKIEFFIDTYTKEAYDHILSLISINNADDVDARFNVQLLHNHEDSEDCRYLHLKGTWEAYKVFIAPPKMDLNKPDNACYHYSLCHYEE